MVNPPRFPVVLPSWWVDQRTAEQVVRSLVDVGLEASLSIERMTFGEEYDDPLVCRVVTARIGNDVCIEVVDEHTIKHAYVDAVEIICKGAVLRALHAHYSRPVTADGGS